MTKQESAFRRTAITIGVVAAVLVDLPFLIGGGDFGDFMIFLLLVISISIAVLVETVIFFVRDRWSGAWILPTYLVVGVALFYAAHPIHDDIRWWLLGQQYKTAVLAQPAPADGSLRHVEWDGWGMAGQDTTVYLVYDPSDVKNNPLNLPCRVWKTRRRGRHWTEATFYTNTVWEDCGER